VDEIKITLETLYDMLRNEKKKEDLQKLEDSFFLDVAKYVREKKALLDTKRENEEIFASSDKSKLDYELRSIQRILKELYEKREKKIIDIALNKSRTGSDIINTSAMLREEKKFYEEILQSLDLYRKGILNHLYTGNLPDIGAKRINLKAKPSQVNTTIEPIEAPPVQESAKTKVKFLHAMPSFVWKDMKVYGPFDEGDEAELSTEVVNLLIKKGRVEKSS
tara:strand:+ start:16818 stop:17480 length:663 start_codon:yes stop_codon:yes gene_type:complete